MRFPVAIALYLLLATIAQVAILPPLRDSLPPGVGMFFEWRLLALAGLLAGLLRGDAAGMAVGLIAAALFGFATDANNLGPAIVSYARFGYGAGWVARFFKLNNFLTRSVAILILLLLEILIFSLTHKIFWPTLLDLPWMGWLVSAPVGAVFYSLMAYRFKRDLMDED